MRLLAICMLLFSSFLSSGFSAQENNVSEKEEMITNFAHDPEDEMNAQEEGEENGEEEEEGE